MSDERTIEHEAVERVSDRFVFRAGKSAIKEACAVSAYSVCRGLPDSVPRQATREAYPQGRGRCLEQAGRLDRINDCQ
jgi:hypothetical protein